MWWWARAALSMRVWVATMIAALALRSAAEPARRHPTEWRGRDLAHSRPLDDLFEPEAAPADPDAEASRSYATHQQLPLATGELHKERRRARNWNKRAPRLPSEIASQMMLRASRSSRPYDVPQIGELIYFYFSIFYCNSINCGIIYS